MVATLEMVATPATAAALLERSAVQTTIMYGIRNDKKQEETQMGL